MSKFSAIAERHWKAYRPTEHQAMQDPETFFQTLGWQIEERVQALAMAIAGPDRPGEDFRAKFARLTAARFDAEADVLRETLPEAEATTEDLDEEELQEQIRFARNQEIEHQHQLSERAWALVQMDEYETPQDEEAAFWALLEQVRQQDAMESSAD